jgi:adenosylmethionine-8-amino-7-oxononanoate aminotransferase
VQRTIVQDGLLPAVQARGAELAAALDERFGNHPHVGDLRGRGLFRGIELVVDRASKTPFASELELHARAKREAMARGLMCYPAGGTVDGRRGDHILLAPPYIIRSHEIGELVDKLGDAVDAAIASTRA